MKKQKRQLLLILGVLVLLAAAYAGLQQYEKQQQEQEEQAAEDAKIYAYTVDTEAITGFSYWYEGQELTFEKDGESWVYTGDTSIDIDEDQIEAMLSSIRQIEAVKELAAPEDLEQYGLLNPADTITIRTGDTQAVLQIGTANSITSDIYMKLSGEDNVYAVASSTFSSFLRDVESLTVTEEEEAEEDTAAEPTKETDAAGNSAEDGASETAE